MAGFFGTQLDFILFFYGLAFILLGATCIAIARTPGRQESWIVLALFAFIHGVGEWLDLTALVISDTPDFALFRTALMTTSFVLLIEFSRQEAIRFGMKAPGRWVYLPLLLLVVLAGVIDGLNAAGSAARYALGLIGALAASVVFARFARGFSGTTRVFAICAAVGFALYAVAAGVIVPAAHFWPASVLNYSWFNQVTGVPIQLVRGVLACGIAFSIWAIWGQQLVAEVASTRYSQFLRQQFIWTLLAMVTILVVGWTLTEFLGDIYKQKVQQETRGDIDLLASRLAGETAAVDGMVKALAGSPTVRSLLVGGSKQDNQAAQAALDLDVEASGAKLGFVLDRAGRVVASSERRNAALPDTPDYRDVSYFQKAIEGYAGGHFAFDAQNGERDYYASYPIRDARDMVVGVAVLKKSLDAFEADLSQFDHAYYFIDPDGVIVLTNRPNMLLRAMWPLPSEKRQTLLQRFGMLNFKPILEREVLDATWIALGGERDYARRRYANRSQWSLVILNPIREIYASRVLGIVITLLVAIMTLIYLFGRERWVHDNVQMEKRLKLQELARDLGFQATTDPLTGLYNRLKFDQALANEMVRSARYNTPLSLVMFDIDRFKAVNDSHGHQVGDKVLTELSKLVADNVRNVDLLARWGGEEFALMFAGCDGAMAHQAAEKLRMTVAQARFDVIGTVTCSFGVTEYVNGDTAATLLARADRALYSAKINGRNRVEVVARPTAVRPDLASVA